MKRLLGAALATFFVAVGFYTSLAALAPTPPVGDVLLDRAGAAALLAILVATGVAALVALARERALRA
ncbi:MAG: hypothetical protein ACREQ5_28805, partial [Candidatus Dormibacteria bacterium]